MLWLHLKQYANVFLKLVFKTFFKNIYKRISNRNDDGVVYNAVVSLFYLTYILLLLMAEHILSNFYLVVFQ
jgi:hypothetical protein